MKKKLVGFASSVSIVLFGAVITFSILTDDHEPIELRRVPLVYRNSTATVKFAPEYWDFEAHFPIAQGPIIPKREIMLDRAGFFLLWNSPSYDLSQKPIAIDGFWSRLRIPLWFILLVLSLLPLRTALSSWQRRRRDRMQEGGLCTRCGYDLRASTGRCPECGGKIIASLNTGSAKTLP